MWLLIRHPFLTIALISKSFQSLDSHLSAGFAPVRAVLGARFTDSSSSDHGNLIPLRQGTESSHRVMRIIGFITPLPQNGGNSQGEVVMDKVVDRSGIPDFMYVKWSNQFFGMGGSCVTTCFLLLLPIMHRWARGILIDLLFVLSQEKTRGCQHHSHKELGLAMDTNLYPVALDPDLLYLVLVLVRTWAKGCWARCFQ